MPPVYDGLVFTLSHQGGPGIDVGCHSGMAGYEGEYNLDITSISFSHFEVSV